MPPLEPSKFVRRPKRLPSLFPWISPLYFVTFNTSHRDAILARDEVYRAFVDFCRRAEDFGIHVGDYVIMPDHIHLLVVFPEREGRTLSSWIASLKNVLGKTLCIAGVSKPHWQEGFFDHVIRDEAGWQEKIEYIHQNPTRANLCMSFVEWPYQGQMCDDLGQARQIQQRRHSAVSTKEKPAG